MAKESTVKPNHDRIILALDVSTLEEACQWIERLPQVSFWKVGLELFISAGPVILDYLRDRGKKIFLDLKMHDIPHTVYRACRSASQYQVDFLTVHASGGRNMLRSAQEAVSGTSTKLLAVTLLTSIAEPELNQDLQIALSVSAYVRHLAILSQELYLAGVVCSPQEAQDLRNTLHPDFLLVTPGIRCSGDAYGDQQRTTTPQAALQAGANFLVLGRSVLQSASPQTTWENLCAQLG